MKAKLPLCLAFVALISGCKQITANDLASLRKPTMDFKAQTPRSLEGTLAGQIETGRSSGVGVSAGGCSSCH